MEKVQFKPLTNPFNNYDCNDYNNYIFDQSRITTSYLYEGPMQETRAGR